MPIDYSRFYERELEQRSDLRSAVATPLGLFSLLGALIASMVTAHRLEGWGADIAFVVLIGSACATLGGSVYYLIRTYHGYTYKGVPTAKELREYRVSLEKWYAETGGSPANAQADVEAYLEEAYAIASHTNSEINLEKWNYLYLANRRLIMSTVLVAFAAVPFLSRQLLEDHSAPQVIEFAPSTQEALKDYVKQVRTQGAVSPLATPATKASAAAAEGHERRIHSR